MHAGHADRDGHGEHTYLLSVDSRRRDRSMHPSPSEYVVPFEAPFRDVTSVEILDATIPRTERLVDVGSDTLVYAVGRPSGPDEWNLGLWVTPARTRTVVLDHGDYDFQQLLDHLNQRLAQVAQAHGGEAAIRVFPASNPAERAGRVLFERDEPFTLLMSSSSLRHTLGFGDPVSADSEHYDAVPGYSVDRPLKASGAFLSKPGVPATEESVIYQGPVPQQDKVLGYDSAFIDNNNVPLNIDSMTDIGLNQNVIFDSPRPAPARLTRLEVHARGQLGVFNSPDQPLTPETGSSNLDFPLFGLSLSKVDKYVLYYAEPVLDYTAFDTLDGEVLNFRLLVVDSNVDELQTYETLAFLLNCNNMPRSRISLYYNSPRVTQDIAAIEYVAYFEVVNSNGINPTFDQEQDKSFCFSVFGNMRVHAVTAPGTVDLTGPRFVTVRCPEIESHLFRDRVNEAVHPGLGLVKLRTTGYADERLDFVAFPTRFFHPIGKLGKLTLKLEKSDGSPYNSHDADHVMTLVLRYRGTNKTAAHGSSGTATTDHRQWTTCNTLYHPGRHARIRT